MTTIEEVEENLRTRIEEFLERPGMYGSQLAVEMQIYLCLDLLTDLKWPDYSVKDKVKLTRAGLYSVLNERHGTAQLPASSHSLSMSDFVDTMKAIRDATYVLIEMGLDELEEDVVEEE